MLLGAQKKSPEGRHALPPAVARGARGSPGQSQTPEGATWCPWVGSRTLCRHPALQAPESLTAVPPLRAALQVPGAPTPPELTATDTEPSRAALGVQAGVQGTAMTRNLRVVRADATSLSVVFPLWWMHPQQTHQQAVPGADTFRPAGPAVSATTSQHPHGTVKTAIENI